MPLPDFEIIKGDARIADLANALSDAINLAARHGVPIDVACSVAVQVAADYGRGSYGPSFCDDLAALIKTAATRPMPADISRQ